MTVQVSDLDLDRLIRYLKGAAIIPAEERWLQEELDNPELLEGLRRLGLAVFPELSPERSCSTYHTDELPPLSSYPDFDLSFLTEEERSDPFWLRRWEDVSSAGRRVHRLVAEVAISLAAPFACLSASLRPALVAIPAPAQRGAEGEETIEVLDLKYPPSNLLIRISRGPVAAQSTALLIDVLQAEPPEDLVQPQPLPATRVALYDENHRLMERMGTDAAGNVRFEDVGTGRYFVQIRHAEDFWEFPLRIDGRGN